MQFVMVFNNSCTIYKIINYGLTYFVEILEGDFPFPLFVIILENFEHICFLHLKTKSSDGNLEQ